MSYARVNDASDSEDETSTPSTAIHSSLPPPRTRRAGSVAAATLAALTRGSNNNRQGYSRLDEDDDDGEEFPIQGPVGAGVVEQRQEDEQPHEQPGQSRRQSQDQVVQRSRTEENADLEINIRFGEGQDLSLRVPRTDTIAQVKDEIKEARPSIGNKYLRLIHSGKILVDNKTLIESLPKSLFTQVEVPHQHHQSRLSSSVEAVEAAANNILAGIASRTSGEKSTPPTIRTHTSLGSILPTHVSTTTTTPNTASTLPPTPSSTATATATTTTTHPLSSGGGGHTIIDIPSDTSSHTNNKNLSSTSTISIPVQTGPIYFLCSLSDFPPAQPAGLTAVKKGKAVATGTGSSSNSNTSGRLRRDGSNRPSRSRGLNASHIPSQSTSSAAAAAAVRVGASSPLSLPGSGSRRQESRHRREDGLASEDDEDETQDGTDEEEEEEEELSPIMTPQATGFDRLREAGFSEDEIRSIRRQFHASRGTVMSTVGENGIAVGLDQDEDANARARRIEEEWIDQHGAETLPEGLEGSYGEMVWGLMLGFFMGLIVMFWFKEAAFSRRQQMGIIAGMLINVGFGVLHLYY
ncbi:hypothetical protein EC957_004333 [Mortierella hygrophila]|uniref:Ubiquitin-like domain-containing protein n=1 Tax=Mortierella hygrophila TaxID=979708 RepID=A0A9P6F1S6_9FUNG|nr:hypothetical protein EC957_004333 [Mortierella hygrophila]